MHAQISAPPKHLICICANVTENFRSSPQGYKLVTAGGRCRCLSHNRRKPNSTLSTAA